MINQAVRTTAFCQRFFGFAETALIPLPALVKSKTIPATDAICGLALLCGIKGMPDPVNQGFLAFCFDRDNIKPAYLIWMMRPALKKPLGRPDDSLLLAVSHTLGRTAESIASAISNFSENQCLAILHDEVNFAKTATVIALQDPESLFNQK